MNSKNFIDLEGINRLISESHVSLASRSSAIKDLSNFNLDSILKGLAESQIFFSKFLKNGEMGKIVESLTRNRPYNFSNMMISSQLVLIENSYNCIFGTFDSIPENILNEILASDSSEESINAIIISKSKEISEYIFEAIQLVYEHEGFEFDHFNLLLKSVRAFNEGHLEASQSLSTVIWDSYLTKYFKLDRTSKRFLTEVKKTSPLFDIDEAADFETLYARVAYGPIIASYVEPNWSLRYSRNATTHNASSERLCLLNSLKSLTIASGLLQYAWRKGDLHFVETQ
jgi:hypothetical protein